MYSSNYVACLWRNYMYYLLDVLLYYVYYMCYMHCMYYMYNMCYMCYMYYQLDELLYICPVCMPFIIVSLDVRLVCMHSRRLWGVFVGVFVGDNMQSCLWATCKALL